jgi:dTDP-4-amino-4,6-dideoxygalactose transaminase
LGDAGAVVTSDAALAGRIRRLRHGGQVDRDQHLDAGVNSRLDELQAAVLRARLPYLERWTARRRALAAQYSARLADPSVAPVPRHDAGHVYHLFPVRTARRDALQRHLRRAGIETLVHYPVPLPAQPAFRACPPADCPQCARAAGELLSLPLHPRLTDDEVRAVAEAVGEFGEFEKGRAFA